jgi:hypothetical protein
VVPGLAVVCAHSQEQTVVDVRQGTDLAVAIAPDGQTLVIDLLGGLWRLPTSGGAATPLTGTGELAKNPQFSPNGRLVVYQRYVGTSWDVWAFDTTTGERWAVTDAPGNELEPTFLADSEGVVFAADRDGPFDLWSTHIRGGPWQLLVGGRGDARFPAISESGDIAYVERSGVETWSLRLQVQGTMVEVLSSRLPLASPTWRPGGGVLVFHETDHASVSRLRMLILSEDRVLRSLTEDEDVFATRLAWITSNEFLYAADGQIWRRQLAARSRRPVHLFAAVGVTPIPPAPLSLRRNAPGPFSAHGIAGISRTNDGLRTAFAALGDIWLIDAGELRSLTRDAYWDTDPVISTDGRFVVFVSDRAGTAQVHRVFADAGSPEQLTFGVDHAFSPSLDPTGTRLAYLTTSGLDPTATATLNVRYLDDGTEVRGGTELVDAGRPEWLEASSGAQLAVDTRGKAAREQLRFDAALRLLDRAVAPEPAPPQPPTPVPQWQPRRGGNQRYTIQAGRLFDATGGGYKRHVDIHIDGDRIVAVVGRNLLPLPEHVVDATELTVVPGLVDAHMHETSLAGEWLGRALLAHGVTTVRAVATDVAGALARAETWAAGRQPGPRMVIAPRGVPSITDSLPSDYPIPILDAPAVLDDPVGRASTWDTPIAASRRLSPLFNPYQDLFGTLLAAAKAEVTSLGVLAPRQVETALARERAPSGRYTAAYERPGAPEAAEVSLARNQLLRARQAMLLRLIRSGAQVAIGSEAPTVPPGLGFHLELELLAAAGVPSDQVLRIATIGGAIALGLDHEIGTVEDGKIADLLVLGGDPLADIRNMRTIRAVVVAGEWQEPALGLAPTPTAAATENLRDLSIQ